MVQNKLQDQEILTRFSDHNLFGVLQQATYSNIRSHTGYFLTAKRSYDNNGVR